MQDLTQEGRRAVEDIAQRHGVSSDAVMILLRAVAAGGGTMAQFSHPELGGMGQWTAGGMVMVGDMFNYGLQQRVGALCSELTTLLRRPGLFTSPPLADRIGDSGQWWPAGLGVPAASGAQNDMRYAYFPACRRLAIQQAGQVRVHDTGDHQISGVSQQQSDVQSLVFTSQHGPVRVADLPFAAAPEPPPQTGAVGTPSSQPVSDEPLPRFDLAAELPRAATAEPPFSSAPVTAPAALQPATVATSARIERPAASRLTTTAEIPPAVTPTYAPVPQPVALDPLTLIERLADLNKRGILSDEEFFTKKTELLRRL